MEQPYLIFFRLDGTITFLVEIVLTNSICRSAKNTSMALGEGTFTHTLRLEESHQHAAPISTTNLTRTHTIALL